MGVRTHVEYMEDPGEAQFPINNQLLIALRMKESTGCIPLAPFDELRLDLLRDPAIKSASQ